MRSPSKGAEAPLYVATAPELEKISGQLFTIGKPLEMKVGEWRDEQLVKKVVAAVPV
jgi:hypothetical protein